MPPNSIKALLDVVVVASELFSSFHSSHLAYVNEEAAIAHNPFLFPLSITIQYRYLRPIAKTLPKNCKEARREASICSSTKKALVIQSFHNLYIDGYERLFYASEAFNIDSSENNKPSCNALDNKMNIWLAQRLRLYAIHFSLNQKSILL